MGGKWVGVRRDKVRGALPRIPAGGERDRKQRGEGKPEAFDFLGFSMSAGKTGTGAML